MQLLLPFIHGHYNGHVVHSENGTNMLHVHHVQVLQHAASSVDHLALGDITNTLDQDTDLNVVSVDKALPNPKQFNQFLFIAILIALTVFASIKGIILNANYVPPVERCFVNRLSPTRAPPFFS